MTLPVLDISLFFMGASLFNLQGVLLKECFEFQDGQLASDSY